MARQSICLSLMVKNEAEYIRRTIASALPHIDCWTAVDTGSTDGTQDIIREALQHLPGNLYERPWRNWGHNRTESITLAKKSQADFVLIMDADQELHLVEMPELDPDAFYWTPVHSGEVIYTRGNLIGTNHEWLYVGVTHEYLTTPESLAIKKLPGYIFIHPDRIATSVERCTDDARLLNEALQQEPNNSRYIHYLAQSYVGMGELKKALELYEKRTRIGGPDVEEVWFSYFQIANIRRVLGYSRDAVVQAFLRAHDYRPSRAEAYRSLSIYFSQLADQIPVPTDCVNVFLDAYKKKA